MPNYLDNAERDRCLALLGWSNDTTPDLCILLYYPVCLSQLSISTQVFLSSGEPITTDGKQ
jgi:hypothetical protein